MYYLHFINKNTINLMAKVVMNDEFYKVFTIFVISSYFRSNLKHWYLHDRKKGYKIVLLLILIPQMDDPKYIHYMDNTKPNALHR